MKIIASHSYYTMTLLLIPIVLCCYVFYFTDYTNIPSEMEDAPPHKLLHFLILLSTAFTAYTAFNAFTA